MKKYVYRLIVYPIIFRYSDTRGHRLRFRVFTNDEFIEQSIGLITEAEKLKEVILGHYPEKPIEGEKESVGEEGWKSTYKLLEAGSEVALDKYDDNVRKGGISLTKIILFIYFSTK